MLGRGVRVARHAPVASLLPRPAPVGRPRHRAHYSGPVKERIIAVDIARGLAVLGMFAAHLGYAVDDVPSPSWLVLADGRPSAMFAILAGVSIALFTGARRVPRGDALVRGYLRVSTRAAAVFVIGVVLMMLGTPVAVILPSYAVTFLLIMPAIGARWPVTLLFAAVVAVAGPTLVVAMTVAGTNGESWLMRTLGIEEGFALDLFITGYYPALIWAAYMLLGLAVGRMNLRDRAVQLYLVAAGAALVLLGHGGSDLLIGDGAGNSEAAFRLITAEPHSDSTFELLGNSGVTLLTLGVLLLVTTAPPARTTTAVPAATAPAPVPAAPGAMTAVARVARFVLFPIAATGSMALTAYSIHIVVIAWLGSDVVWYPESNAVLLWFIVVTLVACSVWAKLLGRGPLERLMRVVTVGGLPASPNAGGTPTTDGSSVAGDSTPTPGSSSGNSTGS